MEVVSIIPRGYCYGVVDALVLVQQVARDEKYPRPIYVLGMIVHNRHVIDSLNDLGVRTLDGPDRIQLLDEIAHGTVVFTAHGVSQAVRQRAHAKGLTVVDATCPDVTRTHRLIQEKVEAGYQVVYIGQAGHPEPEGSMGMAPRGTVHLVENVEDVAKLSLPSGPILVTNQTTMSQWDTKKIIQAVCERYPRAEVHNEICLATQKRQEAVVEQAVGLDLLIVVGDERSNNSNRLVQVAQENVGIPAHRVANITELDPSWVRGCKRVGVTSGASTPTPLTREVIDFLKNFDDQDPGTQQPAVQRGRRSLLPPVRPRLGE